MDLPVALGIAVTFIASSAATFDPSGPFGSEVYFDSLTMFVSFLFGARVLEARARQRAAQSLDGVMRRLPDAVERLDAQGQGTLVPSSSLVIGDRVRVHAGQAFAADGRVVEGRTLVDEAMLSGESRPVDRAVGDEVSAGCINLSAPVVMQVLQLGAQTRYQRIVSLVERALTERPAFILATDRIAGPFLWAVLVLAALAWVAWMFIDPSRALWVAVSVLIVTCPCALSLGAPVALLASAGELARRGILVQRLDALEILTRVQDVVFDKTGTVTEDRLALAQASVLAEVPRLVGRAAGGAGGGAGAAVDAPAVPCAGAGPAGGRGRGRAGDRCSTRCASSPVKASKRLRARTGRGSRCGSAGRAGAVWARRGCRRVQRCGWRCRCRCRARARTRTRVTGNRCAASSSTRCCAPTRSRGQRRWPVPVWPCTCCPATSPPACRRWPIGSASPTRAPAVPRKTSSPRSSRCRLAAAWS